MKCLLCGRPLKNLKSIQLGYGRVCAIKKGIIKPKIIKYLNKYKNKTLEEYYDKDIGII